MNRRLPLPALLGAAVLLLLCPSSAAAQDQGSDAIRGELRAGKFVEAERHARDLLASTERLHGPESREVADVLDLLAEAMRKGAKAHEPEALDVCVRSLRIKERLLPPDDPAIAISLDNLGALNLNLGNLTEGRAALDRALRIRVDSLGPWDPSVAQTLLFLGALETSAARDDSALVFVRRAIAIQDSVLPDGDVRRADGLGLLAMILFGRGEYREAAALTERALGIQLGAFGLNHPRTAGTLHNLGAILSEMGDYAEARRYLEQALSVMKRVLRPGHPLVARSVAALGMVRAKQGDPAGALALYREAVRIERAALGTEHSDVAWYLMHVGRLEFQLGQRGSARRDLREALRIQEAVLGPNHPDLAWTLVALARADAAGGSLDLALEQGERALAIQETTLGPRHPDVAPTLADLARYRAMKGDTTRALDLALRASRVRAEHLRLTSGGLSERQALAYAAVGPTGLDVALSLIASPAEGRKSDAVRRVWDEFIQTRTLVLDEMAARHRALVEENADDATASAGRALEGARQRLANLLVRGRLEETPERYQAILRTARLEMERAERELGRLSAGSRSTPKAPADLQAVFDAAPPGWGVVAYASYTTDGKRRYLAFVHGAGGEPVAVPIGDAERIDALTHRWIESVGAYPPEHAPTAQRAEEAARSAGRSLRAAIWDAIRPALGDVAGVLIVPDGSLHGVNYGALPDDGGAYLVEGSAVLHYITSELDIPATRARDTSGTGLLAFGGVDFGSQPKPGKRVRSGESAQGDDDCDDFYDATFAPLPQSRLEVEEIARAWGDSAHASVLDGDRATEEEFKRLAPGRRVLHLATHGFFLNPNRCLQELAGTRGIGGLEMGVRKRPRPAFEQQSPLLLSGLALADANRRSEATPHEEDGILTAEEVASLDLRGVEWAVLSACDTGITGTSRGEGILGLRRAFRTAGVATLVTSLWPVQDEAAREWMRAFYQDRFSKGVDTAHAVRDAMLEVLRSRRAQGRSTSPFFWAGFVATGDWE
ncbi:MAG TPA: CHAT domain-containing tetratricopeptide repeat protein [Candidatus Eisenbacteria bacterium]|nr:CHAT domain-containing tetratricopeptide repeat protein [Candidatus Eisenbacteria bacterium]